MTEKVCYINEIVIACIYLFEHFFCVFCLISASEILNIQDKGGYLLVQNKSFLSKGATYENLFSINNLYITYNLDCFQNKQINP